MPYSTPIKMPTSGQLPPPPPRKKQEFTSRLLDAISNSDEPEKSLDEYELIAAMRYFLSTVNRVTAYHRHGQKIPQSALHKLVNRQIEMEQLLSDFEERYRK